MQRTPSGVGEVAETTGTEAHQAYRGTGFGRSHIREPHWEPLQRPLPIRGLDKGSDPRGLGSSGPVPNALDCVRPQILAQSGGKGRPPNMTTLKFPTSQGGTNFMPPPVKVWVPSIFSQTPLPNSCCLCVGALVSAPSLVPCTNQAMMRVPSGDFPHPTLRTKGATEGGQGK